MNELLERVADGNQFYHARSPAYASADVLPFRISPEPFYIDAEEAKTIKRIGTEVSAFMAATAELYAANDTVHGLLDRGKPEFFQNADTPKYLFLRPDLIITAGGFTICEIETSVFGLALAELLNRGYSEAGFDTMADQQTLTYHVKNTTPSEGVIVYTDKTRAYAGQLDFLAQKVFSDEARQWRAIHASEAGTETAIYRAHYVVEHLSDLALRSLYHGPGAPQQTLPSLTPQFEEKAIMAFIWDVRFESYYRKALGDVGFDLLRSVIPPTWIVGEEAYFAPGLPSGVESSADIACLPSSQRRFVLKASGFSSDSSWSEGVSFLAEKSKAGAQKLLEEARASKGLYVIQDFHEGVKRPMSYTESDGSDVDVQARVRLTPYFSATDGELLTIKATGCEGTNRIHASTASINTAVSSK